MVTIAKNISPVAQSLERVVRVMMYFLSGCLSLLSYLASMRNLSPVQALQYDLTAIKFRQSETTEGFVEAPSLFSHEADSDLLAQL